MMATPPAPAKGTAAATATATATATPTAAATFQHRVPPSDDDCTSEAFINPTLLRWMRALARGYQSLLDKWNPYVLNRWIASSILLIVYFLRVLYLRGFFVVSYGLGIYLLSLLIGFISPKVDPDLEGPTLPTRSSDEFRPFVRRLPEFNCWYSFTVAVCIALVLTFFSALDVPVFWPLLVFYWVVLCILTLRKQILHMMKHKYVPFTAGKKTYGKKKSHSSENVSLSA
ncbi:OLC1v1010217C1 [Oldenlandia corymbosa var. corymbosa]|uniref:OLC1v1010217C1 n=2 Tax=Oldenlandia corymbosa var. corymbosa TaxID=529605 RepID=A0AAV1DU12_OLDCO|nr:OLC1v1010217C1 [Oldenlandia corymbosa var. corymbosa]